MRATFDSSTKLETGVALDLHVLFPFRVAGETRLAVARVALRSGPAFCSSANGETLDQLAVHMNIKLLRPAHSLDVVLILPLQTHFNQVLAGRGKIVSNRESSSRSEW